MATNTMDGNLQVRGTISADGFNFPANSVGNTAFTATDPLAVGKMTHQYTPLVAQAHGAASAARREVVHVARGAGVLREFRCGVSVANVGAATINFDLYKNGTTVLSASKQLTNAHAAFSVNTGTLVTSPTTYNDGDVFEVVMTVAAGGGTIGQGAWAQPIFEEGAD